MSDVEFLRAAAPRLRAGPDFYAHPLADCSTRDARLADLIDGMVKQYDQARAVEQASQVDRGVEMAMRVIVVPALATYTRSVLRETADAHERG